MGEKEESDECRDVNVNLVENGNGEKKQAGLLGKKEMKVWYKCILEFVS